MSKVLCKFSKTYNNRKKVTDNFCIYASNDFDNMPPEVAKANRSGYAVVKVLGRNLPRLSDWTFQFDGEWKYKKGYGYTFYADRYEMIAPSNLKGMVRYLSSKAFPGVGEKTAEAIVNEFGKETLDVIEKTPELLLRVTGVSIDKLGIIKECYQKNIAFAKLNSYLGSYGISETNVTKIYEKYKEKAIDTIKLNPYNLQEFRGIGFYTCEKIARVESVALDSYIRIAGAIKEVLLNVCVSNGHMFIRYDDLETQALQLLNNMLEPAPVSQTRFREVVKKASKDELIVFRAKQFVLLKQYDDAEEYIAQKLVKLMKTKLDVKFKDIEFKLNDYCESSSIKLSEKQKLAIEKSLMNRISIITGGPGTGKTTILKAIIEIFKQLHPDDEITLLAPTGKAARRMTEATGNVAQTIHSKLGIYDEMSNSNVIIDSGLVVVDEASMVDALLMDKLLKAISSKTTQIIFVGDVDQLPSVGVGLVLQDMINCNSLPVSRLSEVFRQKDDEGYIIDNAYKVNHNKTDLLYDDSFQNIVVKDEEEAVDRIKEIYLDSTYEFGIDNVALLSPLRRTQSGRFKCVADGLNSVIQDELITTGTVASVTFNGTEYRIGDRVLQWRNTEKSANGDIGTITDIIQTDDGVFVRVNWENGNQTEENRESMSDITLAYAISIHKSQGSQYDCVIIPLLSNHICKMYRSNLLYTGLTRAVKKVILVTDGDKALNYCITNGNANNRNTLLAKRIEKYAVQ